MTPEQTEEQRRICEARYWLKQGCTNEAMVEDLVKRVTAKRGREAADLLREDMRRQWKIRFEWWESAPL